MPRPPANKSTAGARIRAEGVLAHPLALPFLLWLAVVWAGIALRPLLPVDETRYLSVAWEMWSGGHPLVPHLNGATYAHKPPVLFWLIGAVWTFVGASEIAARLVAPAFGFASIWMVARLARLLWPGEPAIARLAPLVFAGTGGFVVYFSLTMFDLPLTFFILVALEAVIRAGRGGGWGCWVVCGAALGLGILTKGPVALLHVLPAPLLAPLWLRGAPQGGWGRWYRGAALAVVVCAAVGFAWAIPAAIVGGKEYADELLWGQTADRMVQSFAHRRPFWWFLPLLPALLFPWAWFPPIWRQAWRDRAFPTDAQARLCAVWVVVPLAVFSLISGKQAHYLLPELPAAALLAARWLCAPASRLARWDCSLPALPLLATGLALAALSLGLVAAPPQAAAVVAKTSPWIGASVAAIAVALAVTGTVPRLAVAALAMAMALFGIVANVEVGIALRPSHDLSAPSAYLAEAVRTGRALAHGPDYEGEFNYLARLTRPIEIIGGQEPLPWARAHPRGLLIVTARTGQAGQGLPWQPEAVFPFRGRSVVMWSAEAIVESNGRVLAGQF